MDEIEPESAVPCFELSAQPTEVPKELRVLDDAARVRYFDITGSISSAASGKRRGLAQGEGATSAGELRRMVEERIDRQAKGFYTLAEAAVILADAETLTLPMNLFARAQKDYFAGKLRVRCYADWTVRTPATGEHWTGVHMYCDVVHRAEFNEWLAEWDDKVVRSLPASVHESRILSGCDPAEVSEGSGREESAKERRARLLAMHDAEVKERGPHGALARVYATEKGNRPTADRSNIGKDIAQARREREDARKAGELGRLLR